MFMIFESGFGDTPCRHPNCLIPPEVNTVFWYSNYVFSVQPCKKSQVFGCLTKNRQAKRC